MRQSKCLFLKIHISGIRTCTSYYESISWSRTNATSTRSTNSSHDNRRVSYWRNENTSFMGIEVSTPNLKATKKCFLSIQNHRATEINLPQYEYISLSSAKME